MPILPAINKPVISINIEAFKSPSLQTIFNDVIGVFNQDAETIKSKSRLTSIITMRYIYCYVAHELTSHTYTEIGKVVGATGHSRTLHNLVKVKQFMETGDTFFMECWNLYTAKSKVWKGDLVKYCPCCGRPYESKILTT